ncbi:hypothetical protein [Cupriavidus taiwanensis]|uniref:hypothetical protein n=1 Tax=Cupriavidus taiwanensis TaxID=164546 RepID=UPI0039C2F318
MTDFGSYATVASILFGFASAGSWFRASFVKVKHEDAMVKRKRDAEEQGRQPNLASISLDGWDMSATFAAQARWNAIGAFFAGMSILLQASSQAFH